MICKLLQNGVPFNTVCACDNGNLSSRVILSSHSSYISFSSSDHSLLCSHLAVSRLSTFTASPWAYLEHWSKCQHYKCCFYVPLFTVINADYLLRWHLRTVSSHLQKNVNKRQIHQNSCPSDRGGLPIGKLWRGYINFKRALWDNVTLLNIIYCIIYPKHWSH